MSQGKKQHKRNPVKKNMDRFTRPSTHESKKDKMKSKKVKHKNKWLDRKLKGE